MSEVAVLNGISRLPQNFTIAGWRVERHERLGSTSDEARRAALAGDGGKLWIIAREQTAGRGRQGRDWVSPLGNLYASALIVAPCDIAIAPQIGFVAGVALLAAARDLGGASVQLKWPNDLINGGAKLAGLLVEGLTCPGGAFAVTVGVGVNIASAPTGLAYPTACLNKIVGQDFLARDLFERLAPRFEEALATWARGAGFSEIRRRWLDGAAGLKGPIRVENANVAREGVFEGVDARGRLLLRRGDAIETVESADIFLIDPARAEDPSLPRPLTKA